MKKIYFSIIFCICVSQLWAQTPDVKNFKITQTLNKTYQPEYHDKIYYKFDIKGDYGSDEIKLWLYHGSVSTENFINLIRWNREADYDLNFPNYTNKLMWVSNFSSTPFSTNPGKTFKLVVERNGQKKTLSYTIPYGDSDGDGFNDNVDECPNTPGPDNGCPPGEADLKFNTNGSRVTSDASSSSLTATHQLNYSSSMLSFNFIVDNIGDASSSSTKIEFYRSSNATFSTSDDAKLSPEISIPSISAGSSNGYYSKTLFASDFEYGLSGYWYIIARIKAEDKNTSNNTVAVKVYFNPSRSSFSTATAKTTAPQKNMKVYNFSGVQVIDKTVSSEQEEWETVKSLQPGLYIVKSGDKTYKVKN